MNYKLSYFLLGIVILISIMPFSLGSFALNDTDYQWINNSCNGGTISSENADLAVDENWNTQATNPSGGCTILYENFTLPDKYISINWSASITSTLLPYCYVNYFNITYWDYTLSNWNLLYSPDSLCNDTSMASPPINITIPKSGINGLIRIKTSFSCGGGNCWKYREGGIVYTMEDVSHNTSNPNSVVGENVTFTLKINATLITDINATFYLNNTAYSVPLNGIVNTSSQATITKSILMPLVSSQTQLTYYWNYTVNSFNNATYKANQTISPMSLTIGSGCASGLNVSYNITFSDEINQTRMVESVKYNLIYGYDNNSQYQINGELYNVNSFAICINSSIQNNYSIGYGEFNYYKENWRTRNYYIFKGTRATNITTNLTLFDIESSKSTLFLFVAKDSSLNPYSGYYLALLRWYPENNTYQVVEMGKTDNTGQTVMSVQSDVTDYRVALYSTTGQLIKITNASKISCIETPCTFNLVVSSSEGDYSSIYGVQTEVTQINSDTLRLIYNDPSQNTDSITFYVFKDNGYTQESICNYSTNNYIWVSTCNFSGYSGLIGYSVFRTASPTRPILSGFFELRERLNSVMGLVIQFCISAILGFIALFSPVGAIAMGIVSFVIGWSLGAVSFQVMISIAIIGGIIIHFIGRSGGR